VSSSALVMIGWGGVLKLFARAVSCGGRHMGGGLFFEHDMGGGLRPVWLRFVKV
jgi:hypothetical protein